MSRLHKIQERFISDIYSGERSSAAFLDQGIDNAAERLDIYYNNTLSGLSDALANIYPVTQRIVGEGFFKTVARFYIKASPLKAGNRNGFGHELPAFLQSFEPAQTLPYLPDVAAVESAFFQAGIAADQSPLTAEDIGAQAENMSGFKLALHPSAQIIPQIYNGFEIWQEHKKETVGEIRLVKNAHALLCWRDHNHDILFKTLSEDMEQLFKAMPQHESFPEALEETLGSAHKQDALQQEFMQLAAAGLFVDSDPSVKGEL